ncbi:MAG: protein translocase subunit SecD [bacterium]|nr:protein translocase subunit SecD [bacterium]
MILARTRIAALMIAIAAGLIGYGIYQTQNATSDYRLRYGLDLEGGSQLTYTIDTSTTNQDDISISVAALRDVIERRVNLFGVSEPVVQTETHFVNEAREYRLLVELPGVTDISEATRLIGETPYLEFKTERQQEERERLLAQLEPVRVALEAGESLEPYRELLSVDPYYESTSLNGRYLTGASVQFLQQQGFQTSPVVVLNFDAEGAQLFADLTKANIEKTIGVYLDGQPISTPVVQEAITDGTAIISGNFTPQEATELAGRFNAGALPLPIELLSTNNVGATLGGEALTAGILAGLIGMAFVALYLLVWYRLPGLVAVVSLGIYVLFMLALFKAIPVTLTAAGIAGFVLSLGLAVDANVLIFERLKEELQHGKDVDTAITEGFTHAWRSIRDSNMSSILSAVVLFWFGTSLIKGFALVFGLGTLVSMLTAISITRTLLRAVGNAKRSWYMPLLK